MFHPNNVKDVFGSTPVRTKRILSREVCELVAGGVTSSVAPNLAVEIQKGGNLHVVLLISTVSCYEVKQFSVAKNLTSRLEVRLAHAKRLS